MPLYDTTPSYIETDVHTNRLLILVSKKDFFKPLTRLLGYSMQQPTVDFGAATIAPRTIFRGGQLFTVNQTARGQAARQYTFPIGWPAGNWIMTPIGPLAENLTSCRRDYHLVYLCPDDECKAYFFIIPDALMSPIEPGELVTTEDGVPITATSQLYTISPWLYMHVEQYLQQDITEALHTVSMCQSDESCNDCENPHGDGIYGGGDGVAVPATFATDDFFESGAAITTGASATQIAIGSLCYDNLMLVATSDDVDLATATAGELRISFDGGQTWSACLDVSTGNPLTSVFKALARGGGYFYASGADAEIWRSPDGVNWEQLTNAVTTATTNIHDMDYDESTGLLYLAGEDPAVSDVALVLRGVSITDISSLVSSGSSGLLTAKVLGKNHVAFGDGSGNIHEHQKASAASASDPYRTVVTGSSSPIVGIDGDKFRTVAFSGDTIYIRDDLTGRDFKAASVSAGAALAGNFTASATGHSGGYLFPGYNYFVGVTDTGEIAVLKPCYSEMWENQ